MGGRRLVVEADGGSRGNPGNAGYGALVRDAVSGEVIAERAESVGIASNNVAEYSGLVAGLKAASDIDPGAEVTVRLDSKLLVEQMSGRWKIKAHDLRRLALEARDVVADLSAAGGSVTYTWIPRAENSAADALANSAMDGKPVNWTDTPDSALVDDSDSDTGSARLALLTGTAGQSNDLGEPTRIVLVRHGVTDFTVASKLDGRGGPDPSLNAEGLRQARAAAAGVRAFIGDRSASVITSGLQRAIETGAAIAAELGVGAQIDLDWDEQNFGDWDGKSIGYLVDRYPQELQRFREDSHYSRPGGEAHADLQARVLAAFERATAAGGTVVVASHRKPIMTVLAHVLGIPHERIWRLATAPASLTSIEVWADGGTSVAFVNDTSHLR
ncbi:MAG: bifunctional RNase H/acid phosphatase [Actinobacteria bacterium]|nr:bifunctional RNase H/acid phosphatase [Actinomycetota bacterium]